MSKAHTYGWVVRQAIRTASGQETLSFWHGPQTPWGQHFGPLLDFRTNTLSIAVAVFSTRADARQAMRTVGLKGCVPVPLLSALGQTNHWEAA